jgi:hypothetical protein
VESSSKTAMRWLLSRNPPQKIKKKYSEDQGIFSGIRDFSVNMASCRPSEALRRSVLWEANTPFRF